MQDQVALGALALTLLCQGRHRPRSWLTRLWGREVDRHKPSYIMAAIDRVVHHSVILDLMQVRSFRIQQATGQQGQELPYA